MDTGLSAAIAEAGRCDRPGKRVVVNVSSSLRPIRLRRHCRSMSHDALEPALRYFGFLRDDGRILLIAAEITLLTLSRARRPSLCVACLLPLLTVPRSGLRCSPLVRSSHRRGAARAATHHRMECIARTRYRAGIRRNQAEVMMALVAAWRSKVPEQREARRRPATGLARASSIASSRRDGRQRPSPSAPRSSCCCRGGGMVCRAGNGEVQKSLARPGMSYLVPVGTLESHLELSDRMECLHLYLPPGAAGPKAPRRLRCRSGRRWRSLMLHGLADQVLFHICGRFATCSHRPRQPTRRAVRGRNPRLRSPRIFLGTIRSTRWRAAGKAPSRIRGAPSACARLHRDSARRGDQAWRSWRPSLPQPLHFSRLFRRGDWAVTASLMCSIARYQAARHELGAQRLVPWSRSPSGWFGSCRPTSPACSAKPPAYARAVS